MAYPKEGESDVIVELAKTAALPPVAECSRHIKSIPSSNKPNAAYLAFLRQYRDRYYGPSQEGQMPNKAKAVQLKPGRNNCKQKPRLSYYRRKPIQGNFNTDQCKVTQRNRIRKPVHRHPVQREPVEREPVHRHPVQREPVEREPVHRKPVQRNRVQRNCVQRNRVQRNPVHRKPVHRNPGHRKPVNRKPVNRKPVYRKPVNRKPVQRRQVVRKPVQRRKDQRRPIQQEPVQLGPVQRKPVQRNTIKRRQLQRGARPEHACSSKRHSQKLKTQKRSCLKSREQVRMSILRALRCPYCGKTAQLGSGNDTPCCMSRKLEIQQSETNPTCNSIKSSTTNYYCLPQFYNRAKKMLFSLNLGMNK